MRLLLRLLLLRLRLLLFRGSCFLSALGHYSHTQVFGIIGLWTQLLSNPQDVGGEKSRDPLVSRPVRAVNFGYLSSAESPSPSRSLALCATMTSELLSLRRLFSSLALTYPFRPYHL